MICITCCFTNEKDCNTHLTVGPVSTFERGCHCIVAFRAFAPIMIRESSLMNIDKVAVWLNLDRSHLGASDGNSVSEYGHTS